MPLPYRPVEPSPASKDWGPAALRVVVGLVFLMHGWQKVFLMGVPGVVGMMGRMGAPAPAVTGPLVAAVELGGGGAVLVGLGTRWVAIPLAIDMLSAILIYHLWHGFFAPNGVELVLLLLAGAVTLALAGPGACSLDRLLAPRQVPTPLARRSTRAA